MQIEILCVGKIRERFFAEAVAEYQKRLSRYCSLKVTEVPDEPAPERASQKEARLIKDREGERLLRRLREDAYVIALAIDGKRFSSEGLAAELNRLTVQGRSSLAFLIGGSLGLSDQVLARADQKISFSDLTFPHQLMRVILLEQIYRSFRIIRGEPYHK